MNEVKIQIPDNCELIKDGDTYIVKEKKSGPPRSWEEFCKNYPIQKGEAYIDANSTILLYNGEVYRDVERDKDMCTSKEEAEAFLALMQLRQLRKVWVGNWEQPTGNILISVITYDINNKKVDIEVGNYWSNMVLTFPNREIAKDFFDCFKDLLETAKILL